MRGTYLVALAVTAVQVELARGLWYGTSSGCVDRPGFKLCTQRVYDSSVDCRNNCGDDDDDCYYRCRCVEVQHMINCIATSCWNEVYSCAYQRQALELRSVCADVNTDQIPFFPAPDNTPGGCACNIGQISKTQELITSHGVDCGLPETELEQDLRGCQCCTMSALISSIWDTCPDTDPNYITASYWNETLFGPYDWDTCGPTLREYDCANTLGFGDDSAGGIKNFYNPDNVPENGIGPLTNTGGSITTPISGSTFTWTFGPSTYTITAAANATTVSSANVSATVSSAATASYTTDQGAQETGGGESAAPLLLKPSIRGLCMLLGSTLFLLA
ncbi:hypothetical protein ATEIFO6365_0001010100 [Aspergillus terreus]|uniref:Uncharacterized protein n=1 Tax=Aspergillus terreus TaxID=33178 RepID=A0A5M3YKX9_ASPTE|nr:hypothetical protein ATETN484_0001010000 [Aspergillus terreus]GFF11881.1 hypothetical protein ATEIFO6365_0001010100 [Aspergillus terreus]